jgi:hypothetical protein
VLSVVGRDHDHGLFQEVAFTQELNDAADDRVHVLDFRVVQIAEMLELDHAVRALGEVLPPIDVNERAELRMAIVPAEELAR